MSVFRPQIPDAEPPPARQNRSAEELTMRDTVIAWGRARWPDARVMHELSTGGCRIDLVFVCPDNLIGVEIKSSRDTLDRLDRQFDEFTWCFPEVWLAVAPKWSWQNRPAGTRFIANEIVVDEKTITRIGNMPPERSWQVIGNTATLLYLDEIKDVLTRNRIPFRKAAPRRAVIDLMIQNLTGFEIMREVCAGLRARKTGWDADDPIARSEARSDSLFSSPVASA